jgi:serine/threonine protein kinase
VYKARDTLSDTIVAIKKVKLALTEDGVPMSVLREISLLKQLGKANHPNIVRYGTEIIITTAYFFTTMNGLTDICPGSGVHICPGSAR